MELIQNKRLAYQRHFSNGKIVNIGCGENPAEFGEDTMHVDIDKWAHKNFTQCDAHNLPFEDNKYDTAVLGDILEHVKDPVQVIKEAARVSRKVVLTVFEEWRLGDKPGRYIEEGLRIKKEEMREIGFADSFQYMQTLPKHKELLISIVPETIEQPHHSHIWQFDDDMLFKMIKETGLKVIIFHKFPEWIHQGHLWYNWLLVLKKVEHGLA